MAPDLNPDDRTTADTDRTTAPDLGAEAAPQAADTGAPVARKRAPRRATTKAAAPEPTPHEAVPDAPATAAAAHDALGTPTPAPSADDAAAAHDTVTGTVPDPAAGDEPAPVKKAARRSRKAASAPVTSPAPSPEPEQAADAPAPRRSRGRKATAAVSAPAAAVPAHADDVDSADEAMPLAQVVELAAASETDEPVAVTVVTADELVADLAALAAQAAANQLTADDTAEEDQDQAADDDAAAAVPSFGLLFQAPDPARARRSRRASAPAMAPSPQEAGHSRASDDSIDSLDPLDSSDGAADEGSSDEGRVERGGRRADASRRDGDDAPRGRGRRRRARPDLDAADERPADEVTQDGVGSRSDLGPDSPSDSEQDSASDSEPDSASDSESDEDTPRRRRSRGGRGRKRSGERDAGDVQPDDDDAEEVATEPAAADADEDGLSSSRRRRRRRRAGSGADADDAPGVVTKVREPRRSESATGIKGSTRLEAKKQRRREGREAGRRRTIITEAEFLARREAVERSMIVRVKDGRTQIAVLEDGVLVEHYVSQETSQSSTSIAGNIYLGRVQNVLPSMEAAFVDIGRGRNAVLYAGEVNWDAAGLENGQARRIENAHKSGDTVLVQATKDPIGHKGARLTSQISLPGRYLVFVPNGSMTGISRKLPEPERARLKKILREVMPADAGVIVRTAAEGASEAELRADVARLTGLWDDIQKKAAARTTHAPALLHGEPDLTVRVVRDVFNEDFRSLVVAGDEAWGSIKPYIDAVAPDLAERVSRWDGDDDVFARHRVDEQLAKAMDRKVYLPSGGSLVIDRTEAMTVVDVNTGKFTGAGGNLEETVTKNNIEAAEEVVRQLRLRDIGGIIVIDFIDMVLESNRDLVLRRLVECLGRDRTKHQVAEVTSLGLVQMTRKRVGTGLVEAFSEVCTSCNGRGLIIHDVPVGTGHIEEAPERPGRRGGRKQRGGEPTAGVTGAAREEQTTPTGPTPAQIAAAAHAAAQAAAGRVDDPADADDDTPATEAQVAAAIEQAVSAALGETASEREPSLAEDSTGGPGRTGTVDAAQDAAPEQPRRRRTRRAVSAPAQAPAPRAAADDVPAPGPVTPVAEEPSHQDEREAADAVVPAPAEPQEGAAAAQPRRGRRSRRAVSAPAGPPRSADLGTGTAVEQQAEGPSGEGPSGD